MREWSFFIFIHVCHCDRNSIGAFFEGYSFLYERGVKMDKFDSFEELID